MTKLPANEGSIVKLVDAMLLSSLTKGAVRVWIGRNAEGGLSVDFEIPSPYRDTVIHREMFHNDEQAVAAKLVPAMLQRLTVMAMLPYNNKHEWARGVIVMQFGDDRYVVFGIHVDGAGEGTVARLWTLSDGPDLLPEARLRTLLYADTKGESD